MGEALGEVFGLSASEGENVQQWTARVQEVFLKCTRRANVTFPAQAQGWIALNCAGFNEEQRAIIKAKAQGSLAIDDVTAAMRSCFPGYKASSRGKKPLSALAVEPETDVKQLESSSEENFQDVEAFLADHELTAEGACDEAPIPELEAAEALSVTWRERRQQITQLQRSRKFGDADKAKKSFRVEIEELKKRTKCHRCGRTGHWSRECRSKPTPSSSSTASASGTHEAHMVEHEVAMAQFVVEDKQDVADDAHVETFVGVAECLQSDMAVSRETGLVSSPGFGVIDSGCGRTLIGAETLRPMTAKLDGVTKRRPVIYASDNLFRFGNGMTEQATEAVRLPVGIGKQAGTIDAAIIQGKAPLLLGRPTLERLNVRLNFTNKTMTIMDQTQPVSMIPNQAGQLLIDVLDFPPVSRMAPSSMSTSPVADSAPVSQPPCASQQLPCPTVLAAVPESVPERTVPVSKDSRVPPPPESPESPTDQAHRFKRKQRRKLLSQVKQLAHAQEQPRTAVAELFSPPRFTVEARRAGATGLAFDKVGGCDLLDRDTQQEVDQLLDSARPELLTASPPCTHWGGWDNYNRCFRTPLQQARLVRDAKRQVRFCVQQIHKQLQRNGHFWFEHPLGSRVWSSPEMKPLVRKFGLHKIHMCAYGLKCSESKLPIRKGTGILCSNPDVVKAVRTCPGCPKHQVLEGSSRTREAAKYTPEFVRVFWKHVGPKGHEVLSIDGEALDFQALSCECLAGEAHRANPVPAEALPEEVPENPREPAAPDENPEESARIRMVDAALKKLHNNLGHPTARELIRILRHSKASEEAVSRVSHLRCPVCSNQQQPGAALPANASITREFNEQIGIDVKYLPGWELTQRAPFLNIVDYATSLQVMVALPKAETGEILVDALRDRWIAWAGPPQRIVLDPSQPNQSEVLSDFCNNVGTDLRHTAAESAWQLGKVERHGQWFQRVLQRVLDECKPQSEREYLCCIQQAQSAKNSLLTESGASPYQLVFGRNPRVPTDLLQDAPHVPAVDASEAESAWVRASQVRASARKAVLECHDDRALRAALRARPRVTRPFRSGDWVYYWRTQKYIGGTKIEGGRWYGAALVLGSLGRNLIVAHRRSIMRCSPEQLRFATPEEAVVAEFPDSELLGIRTLLEKGQFPKSQFVDLTQEGRPPEPDETTTAVPVAPEPPALNAAQCLQRQQTTDAPRTVAPVPLSGPSTGGATAPTEGPANATPESYGPVRRGARAPVNPAPMLSRPPDTHPEDFLEIMSDIVPRLVAQLPSTSSSSRDVASSSTSPRGSGHKREASAELDEPPDAVRQRVLSDLPENDALLCDDDVLGMTHLCCPTVEVLMASFLSKRAAKELPVSNNAPELQARVDESKILEWETLCGKQAVRVWDGPKAQEIRRKFPDRFIGSRFVVTNKRDEEGERVKSRWCLQGFGDPDFKEKIMSGDCHSPTLSPLARALILQMLASKKWVMNLGDIKGAFLEAGPIPEKYRPLYAHQPPGGIPGVAAESVIEIVGNVYGANNAPAQWYQEFDKQAKLAGFCQSAFDSCLYLFRSSSGVTTGVMGAHVDDTITGGEGQEYRNAVAQMRARFPYRKWRTGSGELCGVLYTQDSHTFDIRYGQQEYAKHIRPIAISKDRQKNREEFASEKEISALRAVNGALNWLSAQTRPDLCVQASFSQQAFPKPRVRDLTYTNQVVHRARQHTNVEITVRSIPWEDLCLMFHSDAGFGNASENKTQAGYIVAFTDKALQADQPAIWSPITWKSYKLSRVVASTLAGETQSFVTASGIAEWMALMIAEVNDPMFSLRDCERHLRSTPITGITDCKSLYDAIHSPTSPSKLEDKRVAIDMAVVRQCMSRTGMSARWVPTELMLADALTKDQGDPSDLLRAALQHSVYQLSPEAEVLQHKKQQREFRAQRASARAPAAS